MGLLSREDRKVFANVTSDMMVRWNPPYRVSASVKYARSADSRAKTNCCSSLGGLQGRKAFGDPRVASQAADV